MTKTKLFAAIDTLLTEIDNPQLGPGYRSHKAIARERAAALALLASLVESIREEIRHPDHDQLQGIAFSVTTGVTQK